MFKTPRQPLYSFTPLNSLNAICNAQAVQLAKINNLVHGDVNLVDPLATLKVLKSQKNSNAVYLEFSNEEDTKKFITNANKLDLKLSWLCVPREECTAELIKRYEELRLETARNNSNFSKYFKTVVEISNEDAAKLKLDFEALIKPIKLGLKIEYWPVTLVAKLDSKFSNKSDKDTIYFSKSRGCFLLPLNPALSKGYSYVEAKAECLKRVNELTVTSKSDGFLRTDPKSVGAPKNSHCELMTPIVLRRVTYGNQVEVNIPLDLSQASFDTSYRIKQDSLLEAAIKRYQIDSENPQKYYEQKTYARIKHDWVRVTNNESSPFKIAIAVLECFVRVKSSNQQQQSYPMNPLSHEGVYEAQLIVADYQRGKISDLDALTERLNRIDHLHEWSYLFFFTQFLNKKMYLEQTPVAGSAPKPPKFS